MTVIFAILGLGLFGGGLYAIHDGWPYLVLERGFTEVIIGTVAATAGLIMLSLAWILRELKAMRRDFAEAGARRHEEGVMSAGEPLAVVPLPAAVQSHAGPNAALGLGTAAVAAGAVAMALSQDKADEEGAATKDADEPSDRDLFGSLVAQRLADEASPSQENAPEPEEEAEPHEPVQDLFEPAPDLTVALADESREPVEIVAAMVQPVSQDEALAKTDLADAVPVETGFAAGEDAAEQAVEPLPEAGFGWHLERQDADEPAEPAPVAEERSEDRPAIPDDPIPPAGMAPEVEVDEFSALRDSLTSELGKPFRSADREGAVAAEDRFSLSGDDWLSPVSGRREPSFAPLEPQPAPLPSEPPAPVWPPRTEAVAPDEPAPAPEEPIASASSETAEAVPLPEAMAEPQAEAAAQIDPGDQSEPEPKAPEEPASSEEGVVGAYQVGDTQFTIYADGSIRARTPDGEYSFASMDELKVYLASEKSRLGV